MHLLTSYLVKSIIAFSSKILSSPVQDKALKVSGPVVHRSADISRLYTVSV